MSRATLLKTLGLAAVCALLLMYAAVRHERVFVALDLQAVEFYYGIRGPEPLSERLKIVGYTENTLSAFAGQDIYFPLPRGWHGLALRRLADAGAKVVVFDILFSEAGSWDETEDQQLADAVTYARSKGCVPVLAAAIEHLDQGAVQIQSLIGPSPVIAAAGPELGLSNALAKLSYKMDETIGSSLPFGEDGGETMFYSQAVAAFQAVCAQDGRDFAAEMRRADPDGDRQFTINYSTTAIHHPESFVFYETLFPEIQQDSGAMRELTAEELARLRGIFDNGIVFVGSRASADNDYFMTPLGQIYGVETNAAAFDTLLRGRFIQPLAQWVNVAGLVALSLLAWWLAILRPIARGASFAVLAMSGVIAACALAFLVLSRSPATTWLTLCLVFPFVVCTTYSGVTEELSKRVLRGTFSRYLSDEMVQQVLANPALADIGGGVQRDAVVLFTDIRSYSTISEHMEPDKVIAMLNGYFAKVAESILSRGGSVDKYLGDGLMASFGGMIPLPSPADEALDAALDMVRVLYDQVHPELAAQGVTPFKIGIGLHYGKVIIGTMGHARRSDLTMIGDAVNLASRVEGMTKEYGWSVVVTRDLVDALGEQAAQYDIAQVGETTVKGREQPVRMYRVLDPARPEIYRL